MEETTKKKGNKGEDIAAKFLEGKGYKIINRNFRNGNRGEIDIIAIDGEFLVFVEVRSKTKEDGIMPEESINKAKLSQVKKTAEFYLFVNKIENRLCRVDVVTVLFYEGESIIKHYENVTI